MFSPPPIVHVNPLFRFPFVPSTLSVLVEIYQQLYLPAIINCFLVYPIIFICSERNRAYSNWPPNYLILQWILPGTILFAVVIIVGGTHQIIYVYPCIIATIMKHCVFTLIVFDRWVVLYAT